MNIYKFYNTYGWKEKNNISKDAELFEDVRKNSRTYVSNCRKRILNYIPKKGNNILDFASGPIQYKEYLKYSKNFSISSLIIYISAHLNINYKVNYSILTSSLEQTLFENASINLINFNSWLHYFTKRKKLIEIFKDYSVIHIHGIWAPIQLISLLVCINLKKFLVIMCIKNKISIFIVTL